MHTSRTHHESARVASAGRVEKEIARLLYKSDLALRAARGRDERVRKRSSSVMCCGPRSHLEVEMSPGLDVMGLCRNFFEPVVSPAWAERVEAQLKRMVHKKESARLRHTLLIDYYIAQNDATQRWLDRVFPGSGFTPSRGIKPTGSNVPCSVRVRETTRIDAPLTVRKGSGRVGPSSSVEVQIQTKQSIGSVTFAPACLRDQRAVYESRDRRVLGVTSAAGNAYGMRLRANVERSWTSWKRSTPLPLNGVIIPGVAHARLMLRTTYVLPEGIASFDETRPKTSHLLPESRDSCRARPLRIDVCRVWEGKVLRDAQSCMERGEPPSVSVELEYAQNPCPRTESLKRSGAFARRPTRRVCENRLAANHSRESDDVPRDAQSWMRTAREVLRDACALLRLGSVAGR